jgi:hypothetical protein
MQRSLERSQYPLLPKKEKTNKKNRNKDSKNHLNIMKYGKITGSYTWISIFIMTELSETKYYL